MVGGGFFMRGIPCVIRPMDNIPNRQNGKELKSWRAEQLKGTVHMKILIMNAKGGVGKTTIAGGLASFAALRRDKKVLVVGADPQRSTDYFLRDSEHLHNAYVEVDDLADVIEQGSPEHDVMIFDTPPRHDFAHKYLEMARRVDFTLVPWTGCGVSFDASRNSIAPLLEAGLENWAFVINGASTNPKCFPATEKQKSAIRDSGAPVMESVIRQRQAWKNLSLLPKNILIHEYRDGAARHEIEALYLEIEKHIKGGLS